MNHYLANLIRRSTGRAVMLSPDVPPLFGPPEPFEASEEPAPRLEYENPRPVPPVLEETARRKNAVVTSSIAAERDIDQSGDEKPLELQPRTRHPVELKAENPRTVDALVTKDVKPRPFPGPEETNPQRAHAAETHSSLPQHPAMVAKPEFTDSPHGPRLRIDNPTSTLPTEVDKDFKNPATVSATPTGAAHLNVPAPTASPQRDRVIESVSKDSALAPPANMGRNSVVEHRAALPAVPSVFRAIANGNLKGRDETASEQPVHISIGRIEVRSSAPAKEIKQELKPVKGRSLDAYLRARSQRGGQ